MSKLQTVEIKLPFAGFYNSVYSDEVDQQESQYIEHHCDESDGEESEWPEPLRLDGFAYADFLMEVTSYSDAYRAIARDYVESFSYLAGEALGISARESVRFYSWADGRFKREKRDVSSLRLTFAEMTSPREYNFATDRIFANIPVSVIRKLWAISKTDDHATLTGVAARRFTSRSGFISHYESDWREWGQVATWDHNQLETLLIAASEISRFDWSDSDLGIYYATTESECAYNAWESAVDWPAFDAKRQDARAEKLAAWIESDAEKAKAWIGSDDRAQDLLIDGMPDGIPYCCKLTPDLFTN